MARLKNQLPPKLEHGHPVGEQPPRLPTSYLAIFVFPVKRLGPSPIPTKVVLPLENLDRALTDIEGGIKQPLVIEGMVSGEVGHILGADRVRRLRQFKQEVDP